MIQNKDSTSIAITLGNNAAIAITEGDELHFIQDHWAGGQCQTTRINIGRATKKRFDELKRYLDRLSIHAVDS